MRSLGIVALLTASVVPALAASGAAGGSSFPPFDSRTFPSQLLWLAITFGAVYFLMSRIALPRLGSVLEERREKIDSALRSADEAQKQAEAAAVAHEQALAKAKGNAQAIAQEARARSAKEVDAKRHAVESDLAGKMAAAEARIAETKAKAMANVTDIAKEAATAMVETLSGKKPTAAALNKAFGAQGE